MRMAQICDHLGFLPKGAHLVACQMGMQNLDGGLYAEVDMFSQIHFCEASLSEQLDQSILPKLLSDAACRHTSLLREPSSGSVRSLQVKTLRRSDRTSLPTAQMRCSPEQSRGNGCLNRSASLHN